MTIVAAAIVELAILFVPAAIVPVPPAPTTSKSAGSRSQVPLTPWSARVLTVVLGAIVRLFPDVSMKPPLPLVLPPSADRRPVTRVFSALARMVPPFPTAPTSAFRPPAIVRDPPVVEIGVDDPVKVTTPLLMVRPVALARFPPVSKAGRVWGVKVLEFSAAFGARGSSMESRLLESVAPSRSTPRNGCDRDGATGRGEGSGIDDGATEKGEALTLGDGEISGIKEASP